MGTVYAIANQKGGVGKTTTAVNVAACIAAAGYETLLVDVDPQGNATVGLGVSRDAARASTTCCRGDVAAADAVRADGDRAPLDPRLDAGPRRRDDGAAAPGRAPRRACATRWRRCATRYAFVLLDCPPSLGPLTVNALVAADRVIVPVQTEYFALEGLAGLLDTLVAGPARAQPAADGRRDAADDARRAHAARAGRRARGPRALPGAGLRHRDPAQRPARRGAELRPAGHPPRPALRRLGGLLRARQGGGRPWLSAQRGMGRGLAAILLADDPGRGQRRRRPSCAEIPVELIAPNPRQPRQRVRRGRRWWRWRSRCASAACCSRCSCGPCPGGTYELIAGERRWRAAQLAGLERVPAVVAPARATRESLELALIENMAREDLNPVEEARACALLVEELGLTREEVGRRVGRSRVAVSNLMRLLDLPDEVLEMLVEGRLTEGHGRALLMAPDHADRRRLARAAADEGWTVRETEARARDAARPPEVAPRAGRALPSGPAGGRRAARRTRSAAPSAPTSAWRPARTGYRVTLASTRSRRHSRRGARRLGEARYHPRRSGRLAQSVRALL